MRKQDVSSFFFQSSLTYTHTRWSWGCRNQNFNLENLKLNQGPPTCCPGESRHGGVGKRGCTWMLRTLRESGEFPWGPTRTLEGKVKLKFLDHSSPFKAPVMRRAVRPATLVDANPSHSRQLVFQDPSAPLWETLRIQIPFTLRQAVFPTLAKIHSFLLIDWHSTFPHR